MGKIKIFKKFLILLCILFIFFNTTFVFAAEISTSTFSVLWDIVLMARNFAGICCLCIILVAVFKIIMGDENDIKKYITRIKNALIALVLILTIVNLTNVVVNSLMGSSTDYYSIGDITNTGLNYNSADLNGDLISTVSGAKELISENGGTLYSDIPDGESGLYLINNTWYYYYDFVESDNVGGVDSFNVTNMRLLNTIDDNSKAYYVITPQSSSDEGWLSQATQVFTGKTSVVSRSTGNTGYFPFEYPTFASKIYSYDDLVDAVNYRLVSTTDENGDQYYTSVSDSIMVNK